MKVKDLRQLIDGLPDDMDLVLRTPPFIVGDEPPSVPDNCFVLWTNQFKHPSDTEV